MPLRRLGARSGVSILLDGLERAAELFEYRLKQDFNDDLTLVDPFAGSDWTLSGSAFQSLDGPSLYRYTRANSGRTVGFTIRPLGNAAPTPSAPHYRGKVVVGPKPDLGGSADDKTFIFEFAWFVIGEPEEVTA